MSTVAAQILSSIERQVLLCSINILTSRYSKISMVQSIVCRKDQKANRMTLVWMSISLQKVWQYNILYLFYI